MIRVKRRTYGMLEAARCDDVGPRLGDIEYGLPCVVDVGGPLVR